jgi:hypothetical protein
LGIATHDAQITKMIQLKNNGQIGLQPFSLLSKQLWKYEQYGCAIAGVPT